MKVILIWVCNIFLWVLGMTHQAAINRGRSRRASDRKCREGPPSDVSNVGKLKRGKADFCLFFLSIYFSILYHFFDIRCLLFNVSHFSTSTCLAFLTFLTSLLFSLSSLFALLTFSLFSLFSLVSVPTFLTCLILTFHTFLFLIFLSVLTVLAFLACLTFLTFCLASGWASPPRFRDIAHF